MTFNHHLKSYCGVLCQLYDDVAQLGSDLLVCEESEQHRAKYRALRCASVHYKRRSVFWSCWDLGSSVSRYTVQKVVAPGYAACLLVFRAW